MGMREAVHTEEVGDIVVKIYHDEDCQSPVEDDEAIIFCVLHRRYSNPAPKAYDLKTAEDVKYFARRYRNVWQEYPLYMYDHSGTAYSITPFTCPWDSGRVGSIFVKKSEFAPNKRKGVARSIAETYTQWANGECYGYVIETADGDELDSCWGFIGNYEGDVLAEGRSVANAMIAESKIDDLGTATHAPNT